MEHIESFPEVKIKIFTPSEIVEAGKRNPSIADHIIDGYGMPVGDKTKEQVVEEEFDHGENRTVIFLAEVEGRVVGSLYFILWKNDIEDKRGGRLIEFIKSNTSSELDSKKLFSYKVLACDVGIVVHPDFQGKGVAGALYKAGIEYINPALIVGQTKTPGAVIARSRVLATYGYITAYAGIPISVNLTNSLAIYLTEAFYYSKNDVVQRLGTKNIHYAHTEALQPEITVDASKLNNSMREIYSELLGADKTRPEGYITFAPLISLNSNILK